MEIREERQEDIEAIGKLNDVAFKGSAEESRIIERLREDGDLLLSLVAVEDEQIIGHIAFSPMTIDGTQAKLVGLAPMAVAPEKQRTGIGTALIEQGLQHLKERGVDAVFVLGHQEYYPRFGFKPANSVFGIQSTYKVPDRAFMALEIMEGALTDLCGFVRYAPAFS